MKVTRLAATTAAALLLGTAAPDMAHAQDGFLFDMPGMSLTFRAGPVMHRAESPVFDFITTELTLDRSDFRAPALGAEFGIALHPRVDFSLGLGWSETDTRSEFREFVEVVDDPDNPGGEIELPIEQTTRLRTIPLSVSARFYPLSRGREVSSLAWLPTRTTPYVGAGVDFNFYRLQQVGDFVVEEEDQFLITTQDYQSSGRATTAHARLGIDHWFSPTVGLNLEGRYMYGTGRLEGDFIEHDRIDLSGAHVGLGLTFRW